MKSLDLQILVSFHLLFAAVFVGSNVFLDFLLTPRLDLIPPGQAARLGDKLGTDFAWLNWIALLGSPLSGLLLLWRLGTFSSLADPSFYVTGYGAALLSMMTIWLTLMVTAAILTFYLRPRVVVKLPYDATRQQVEGSRTRRHGLREVDEASGALQRNRVESRDIRWRFSALRRFSILRC